MSQESAIPTPRTDFVFEGDISVGVQPDIQDWKQAKEWARHLERELTQLTLAYQKAVADGLELKRQRDESREDADCMARVLFMHDKSQISLTIPEWESMKVNALAAHTKLEQQEKV